MNRIVVLAVVLLFCTNARAQPISQPGASYQKTQLVAVDSDVKLEVVDWGGSGRPIIFLPSLNASAHAFDMLASKFTGNHHVYGITRRGMAPSSIPAATDQNYDADRLGDDVLAVMKALNISRPVLVGESIGGQELSSIGERYPDEVAGLVYLDATGPFAFYVSNSNSMAVDIATVRRDLAQLPKAARSPSRSTVLIREIQDALPSLQAGLTQYANILGTLKELPPVQETPQQMAADAIQANSRKYTAVKAPILAIIAVPHACAPDCEKPSVKALAEVDSKRADAFAAGNPNARIVRLAYAQHEVYRSNEADVVRQTNSFIDGLH